MLLMVPDWLCDTWRSIAASFPNVCDGLAISIRGDIDFADDA
jgi:hypothetical protein